MDSIKSGVHNYFRILPGNRATKLPLVRFWALLAGATTKERQAAKSTAAVGAELFVEWGCHRCSSVFDVGHSSGWFMIQFMMLIAGE